MNYHIHSLTYGFWSKNAKVSCNNLSIMFVIGNVCDSVVVVMRIVSLYKVHWQLSWVQGADREIGRQTDFSLNKEA